MEISNLKIEHSQLKHKQQGAVLFISLMVLLILTLIGISSLNGSLLEEKMAANSLIATTVFQSADSAIKTAYYEQKLKPGLAVTRAENNYAIAPYTVAIAIDGVSNDTTRSALLKTPPETTVKTPCPNNSYGTVGTRVIEIVGTASMGGIEESNSQGFTVCPMRP